MVSYIVKWYVTGCGSIKIKKTKAEQLDSELVKKQQELMETNFTAVCDTKWGKYAVMSGLLDRTASIALGLIGRADAVPQVGLVWPEQTRWKS